MGKVRVNFYLSENLYEMIQEIAQAEDSSSADIFRKAVKKYVYLYKTDAMNEFYSDRKVQSIAHEELDE